ncbi:hypothetical protein AGMMS50225_06700 [Betaproteobacteria bacterium]|nr:hypothetical protein AGMMS50225_06700 [Betaproteobacteria bacterium]
MARKFADLRAQMSPESQSRAEARVQEMLVEMPPPEELPVDPENHDAWFRAKVHEALADTRPALPHQALMDEVQALIDRKRHAL